MRGYLLIAAVTVAACMTVIALIPDPKFGAAQPTHVSSPRAGLTAAAPTPSRAVTDSPSGHPGMARLLAVLTAAGLFLCCAADIRTPGHTPEDTPPHKETASSAATP
jgi:hypothetical protein